MKTTLILFLALSLFSFFSCNIEPLDNEVAQQENVIKVESQLFSLIERIAVDENSVNTITCIDFIYPFTLFKYDANLLLQENYSITNDTQFSEVLSSLSEGESISLSLPITISVENSEPIILYTYDDLNERILDCINEDFIAYCNANLPLQNCIWNVENNETYDNSFYVINNDGSVTYYYNELTYSGTWIVYLINGQAHLNINLQGNSNTSTFWNFDWKISLDNESNFILENSITTIKLSRECFSECLNSEIQVCTSQGVTPKVNLFLYNSCLFLQNDVVDDSTFSISYHLNETDANLNINALDYFLDFNSESINIFYRIDNSTNSEFIVGSISFSTINDC